MTSMIRTLQEMGLSIRETIPTLNSGGCAVYAALVGSRLEELGYVVRGVVSDYEEQRNNLSDLFNSFRPRNTQQWRYLSHYAHVLLTIEIDDITYLHDSDHTIAYNNIRTTDENIKIEPTCHGRLMDGDIPMYALRSLASAKVWNSLFPRKESFPIIERLIEDHLGTFERSRRARYIRTDSGIKSFFRFGPDGPTYS